MKTKNLLNKQGKIWLNVASAQYTIKDFHNLDNSIYFKLSFFYPAIRPLLSAGHKKIVGEYALVRAKNSMIMQDCRKPLQLPAGSVDHILCSHFLEHVYPEEANQILKDFYRVLKKGGTVHIIVPNLEVLIQSYVSQKSRPEASHELLRNTLLSYDKPPTRIFRLLEMLGYEGMGHRWMYDTPAIAAAVANAGFELLENNNTPSSHVRADDGEGSIHIIGKK